jgi:hypothetical protein
MDQDNLNRREFSKLTMAAFGGLVAGAALSRIQPAAAVEPKSKLLEGPNVCRGLNHSCKNHKGGNNACAGQGACHTVPAHTCNGANDCKGQGGCGAKPGENDCKGQGACAVPLMDSAWKKARANFEAAMKAANKKFGPAPAKK